MGHAAVLGQFWAALGRLAASQQRRVSQRHSKCIGPILAAHFFLPSHVQKKRQGPAQGAHSVHSRGSWV